MLIYLGETLCGWIYFSHINIKPWERPSLFYKVKAPLLKHTAWLPSTTFDLQKNLGQTTNLTPSWSQKLATTTSAFPKMPNYSLNLILTQMCSVSVHFSLHFYCIYLLFIILFYYIYFFPVKVIPQKESDTTHQTRFSCPAFLCHHMHNILCNVLPHLGLNRTFFFSFFLLSIIWQEVTVMWVHSQRVKPKHWRHFKLDDQEAPLDSIFVDEGHRCRADNMTAAHLTLREKIALMDVDLVLV